MSVFTTMLTCFAANGSAQVPGLPVLQNAFSNQGLAFAANFGGGKGQSFYGAAAGWGMGGGETSEGRFSLSGAAGAQRANDATRGSYGGRLTARLWSSGGGGLGVAGFAGAGGAPRTRAGDIVTNPAVVIVPVGLSVGYRRALGKRGISAYLSPLYRWVRTDSATVTSEGALRVSGGLDFSLTSSIGVTIGGEFGGGGSGKGSSSSSTIGAAVSFVPSGRR